MRKTKNYIIETCKSALREYNKLCDGFLSGPNADAIKRKARFVKLIGELERHGDSPEESIIKLYDFYCSQSQTSRLIKIIQNKLIDIFEIPPPILVRTRHESDSLAEQITLMVLHQKAEQLKFTEGLNNLGKDIPLQTFKRG